MTLLQGEEVSGLAERTSMPGVEIETKKCYPCDFSPILNVIVSQLSPGITGRLGGNKWEVQMRSPVRSVSPMNGYQTDTYWVTDRIHTLPICYP